MTELSDAEALALATRMNEGSVKEREAVSEACTTYVMRLQDISGHALSALVHAGNDVNGVFIGLVDMAGNHGNPKLAVQMLRDTARFYTDKADEIERHAKAATTPASTLIH